MREMEKTVSQKFHRGTILSPENMSQFFRFLDTADCHTFSQRFLEKDSQKTTVKKGDPRKVSHFFHQYYISPLRGPQ